MGSGTGDVILSAPVQQLEPFCHAGETAPNTTQPLIPFPDRGQCTADPRKGQGF